MSVSGSTPSEPVPSGGNESPTGDPSGGEGQVSPADGPKLASPSLNVASSIADLGDLGEVAKRIDEELERLATITGCQCFPLLVSDSMGPGTVDNVFQELRERNFTADATKFAVIIDSPGGDINSAYNLALLLRRYGRALQFIIPRWAKSAATLLVLSGDEIRMTPIAEVGPVDPQITAFNPLENRLEEFSPLAIESTLELIRREFREGNDNLAEGLLRRLQFPLTLGSFKTSLDVGKVYIKRLLSTRMMKGRSENDISAVADRLVEGYTDHGFVIGCQELVDLGLNVREIEGDELDSVWTLHLLNRRREQLVEQAKRDEIQEKIRQLPPELMRDTRNSNARSIRGNDWDDT